jgi:tripartite-type tricarboxylate transporter receptor subunit TctC
MIKKIKPWFIGLCFGVSCWSAVSQTYPDRAIKILQGFAPGGNADNIARSIGLEISKSMAQSVVVEAQTGAGGTIASASVARAKPDGYTLLLATGGHAVAGALYNSLPYKTVADYEMISTITYFPFLIVTSAESKFKSFTDLLDAARNSPSGLTYGSAGIGSTHHLAGELLGKMGHMNLVHIPYRGVAPACTDLIGGQTQAMFPGLAAAMPHIRSGRVRPLAVTGASRHPLLKDTPTLVESGYPGFDAQQWYGVVGPANMPAAIVKLLNESLEIVLKAPDLRDKLSSEALEPAPMSPEKFAQFMRADIARWTKLAQDRKIDLDA